MKKLIKIFSRQNFKILLKNGYIDNKCFSTAPSKIGVTNNIDPYYISGLTQADGSFSCGTIVTSNGKNISFKPKFEIVVDFDSKQVLEKIQLFFGCGTITDRLNDHTSHFIVHNKEELRSIIVPHFKKYPVFFNKLHAFNLLIRILELLAANFKDRDNISILRMAVSMNAASRRTEEQIQELAKILGYNKKINKIPDTISNDSSSTLTNSSTSKDIAKEGMTPGFLAGLIDGDGSFNITFQKNGNIKPVLSVCIGSNALPFREYCKKYLGDSGALYKSKSIFILKISKFNDIFNYVIPFMDSNPIHTEKKVHYDIWKEVCFIIKNELSSLAGQSVTGNKLSKTSLLKIVDLAYNMNKSGKRRKLTKVEYINLINKIY